jgi:hypothetical protein
VNNPIEAFVKIAEEAAEPARVAEAAQTLLDSGASLEGAPPPQLVATLLERGSEIEAPLLNLARAWSRVEMSRAMLDALSGAVGSEDKEQAAWLLKTVLAAEHSGEAIERVLDGREEAQVRRWLLEGLERLTFGAVVGWAELGPVVERLAGESAPALKAGVAGLLSALPWREESVGVLRWMLEDENAEVVSAAAHTLARHPEAVSGLDPGILERLRRDSSSMVRASGAVLAKAIRRV